MRPPRRTLDLAPEERSRRRERVARIHAQAFRTVDAMHLPVFSEAYYTALRAALVDGGETEREIDGLAACLVTAVIAHTRGDRDERLEQFELIQAHLACTAMRVTIWPDDAVLCIEFPDRPRVH